MLKTEFLILETSAQLHTILWLFTGLQPLLAEELTQSYKELTQSYRLVC